MNKIIADKRTRTYSDDDHTYTSGNGHHNELDATLDDSKVPETIALTKTGQSFPHNKFLDIEGAAGTKSVSASQRSIARRNASNPFARAVSSFTINQSINQFVYFRQHRPI